MKIQGKNKDAFELSRQQIGDIMQFRLKDAGKLLQAEKRGDRRPRQGRRNARLEKGSCSFLSIYILTKEFIMNKMTIVSALLMGMFAQGAFAAGATTNNTGAADGTITFTGMVTDAPCTVSTSDQNQTVVLGQIKTSKVTGADATDLGHKTPFSIHLQNCTPTLSDGATAWTKMAVTFTDNADASNITKVLNNTGSATGVSVGLQNKDGTDITLGTASTDITAVVGATSQVLPFNAHFVKVGAAAGTAGTIEAKSDFIVSYK